MSKIILCFTTLSLTVLSGCTGGNQRGITGHQQNLPKNGGPSSAIIRAPHGSGVDPVDVAISQRIRQAILGDATMSVNAQNVGIITVGRHVTVSGAVDDPAEAAKVLAKVKAVPDAKGFTSALEVLDKDAEQDEGAAAARRR